MGSAYVCLYSRNVEKVSTEPMHLLLVLVCLYVCVLGGGGYIFASCAVLTSNNKLRLHFSHFYCRGLRREGITCVVIGWAVFKTPHIILTFQLF